MIDHQDIINRMIAAENAKREAAIVAFMHKHDVGPDALIQEVLADGTGWKILLLTRDELYKRATWWRRLWLRLRFAFNTRGVENE
jgi:hypothetical protein